MEAFETAGISTAFLVIVGVLYRVIKKSDFSFSSSCKRHIVEQARQEVDTYIKERIEQEIRSIETSPRNGSAKAPELPPSPKEQV